MVIKGSIFKYFSFLVFSLILLFTACIPTKKVAFVDNLNRTAGEYEPVDWNYKIQAGDRFYIKIINPLNGFKLGENDIQLDNEDNSAQNLILQAPSVHDYTVNEEGNINLPELGEIMAKGKSIHELEKAILQKCDGIISNPSIKLFMTNYNVTLLGEFNQPGFYQLITATPTFFDAVGLGNDLTDFANRSEVKIIRKKGEKVEISYVDVTDPNFISSPYYFIQPNDVIHVMPLKVKKYSNDNGLPLLLSGLVVIVTLSNILINR